jgi:hypothetical protein
MINIDLPTFPEWGVGDTRDLDDRARWKIVNEHHRSDGRCVYTLECIAVGVRED